MKELRNEIKNMSLFERKEINGILFEKNSVGSYNIYCGSDKDNFYELSDSANWVFDYKLKYLIELINSRKVAK